MVSDVTPPPRHHLTRGLSLNRESKNSLSPQLTEGVLSAVRSEFVSESTLRAEFAKHTPFRICRAGSYSVRILSNKLCSEFAARSYSVRILTRDTPFRICRCNTLRADFAKDTPYSVRNLPKRLRSEFATRSYSVRILPRTLR